MTIYYSYLYHVGAKILHPPLYAAATRG